MKKVWYMANNPFLNATARSYARALTISAFTDAALSADAAYAEEYAFYHPIHLALKAKIIAWLAEKGSQKSSTATFAVLLKDLPRQARDWSYDIQGFAKKGTPEYLEFFPNGLAPFRVGKQQERMSAIGALSNRLGTRSPVPPIKATIDDYLTDMTTANATQKGKISQKDALSEDVEAARLAACIGLYNVLLKLLLANYHNPEVVMSYFDMELIRKDKQKVFTGSVAMGSCRTIAKRTMKAEVMITLENTGTVPLTFYFANTKNGAMPEGVMGIIVHPLQTIRVATAQLGHPATDKFLSVYNPSEIIEGEWVVEL